MNISLTEVIHAQVASGMYNDASEMICESLYLMIQQKQMGQE